MRLSAITSILQLACTCLMVVSFASGCRVCSPQCNLKTGYQVGLRTCEQIVKGQETEGACCPPYGQMYQGGGYGGGGAYSGQVYADEVYAGSVEGGPMSGGQMNGGQMNGGQMNGGQMGGPMQTAPAYQAGPHGPYGQQSFPFQDGEVIQQGGMPPMGPGEYGQASSGSPYGDPYATRQAPGPMMPGGPAAPYQREMPSSRLNNGEPQARTFAAPGWSHPGVPQPQLPKPSRFAAVKNLIPKLPSWRRGSRVEAAPGWNPYLNQASPQMAAMPQGPNGAPDWAAVQHQSLPPEVRNNSVPPQFDATARRNSRHQFSPGQSGNYWQRLEATR